MRSQRDQQQPLGPEPPLRTWRCSQRSQTRSAWNHLPEQIWRAEWEVQPQPWEQLGASQQQPP